MCPFCLSIAAWMVLGGGSASTLALLIGLKRKGKCDGDGYDDASDSHP